MHKGKYFIKHNITRYIKVLYILSLYSPIALVYPLYRACDRLLVWLESIMLRYEHWIDKVV
jgi:hypothetical protein